MENPADHAQEPARQRCLCIADRLLAQLQRMAPGQIAQSLVVIGVHGGSFRVSKRLCLG
jgi:hypothetical protein